MLETKQLEKEYQKAQQELEEVSHQMRKAEMKCYLKENYKCVQEFDEFKLRHAMLYRRRNLDMELCQESCKPLKVHSKQDPEVLNKFYECISPCYHIAIDYFGQETQLMASALKNFKNKYLH